MAGQGASCHSFEDERESLNNKVSDARSEKIDICVLGEARQHDDLLLAPLKEKHNGWYTLSRHRINASNGGVALLVDRRWDKPDEINTGLEDVICARVTNRQVGRAYHIIGVYIPHGSDDAHAKRIFDKVAELAEKLPNPIILGDLNAHLPNRDEDFIRNPAAYPAHNRIPPRARNEWAKPPNARGKRLLAMVNRLDFIIANGRKDGSHQHARQMLTQVDTRYNPARESLIDYVVLPLHLYSACTSLLNNFIHNDYGKGSTGVVKTGHALMSATFWDDLVITPHQPNTAQQTEEETKTVFEDPYELPMHKHVRESYADSSDARVDEWRATHFNNAAKSASTDPQAAVNSATESFAEAVMQAATSALKTKEVSTKKAHRKLKPSHWSKEIQVLSQLAHYARSDLVAAIRQYSGDDDIESLRHAVTRANDNLYAALASSRAQENTANAEQIESDLAHAGTEATNYVGGGGYIKRAWNLLKRPLLRAKADHNALPVDMHGTDGEPSKGPTANANAWRASWAKQGQYNALDPAYDNKFAAEIDAELRKIKAEEHQLKDEELMALLEALSNNGANANQEDQMDGQDPPQCPAQEVANQIRKDMDDKRNQIEADEAAQHLLNRLITEAELRAALERTPNYKAAGADGIKGEFLRYLGDSAVSLDGLLQLYNFIFQYQLCPEGWTKDIAWPLYKQGVKRDPTNYRLITLMSVMAKVFERIMHTRLTAWTHKTKEDVIDPTQVGFQANRCTLDHLYVLTETVRARKQEGRHKSPSADQQHPERRSQNHSGYQRSQRGDHHTSPMRPLTRSRPAAGADTQRVRFLLGSPPEITHSALAESPTAYRDVLRASAAFLRAVYDARWIRGHKHNQRNGGQ